MPLTLILACNDDRTPVDEDGNTETGDGDGDPTTGDGDPTTGDGDPTTGDGDPTTTGDGDPTGDGDGDGDGDAMVRLLHLGLDAPAIDIYVNDQRDPVITDLEFEWGTDYMVVPPGAYTVSIVAAGEPPDEAILTIDPLDLEGDVKYSAVAYHYVDSISALVLIDDDEDIDADVLRLQVTHTAPDVGQVDIWALTDPPIPLIEDLDFGASTVLEVPAGPGVIGVDVDDDMIPDITFTIPDLGGGILVDVYAVNEAGGAPVFLLAHLPDGSTARIDADVCGDGIISGFEVCDGDNVGGLTCEDLEQPPVGSVGCLADCSDYDTSMCSSTLTVCNDTVTPIPDDDPNGVTIPIEVDILGVVADIDISVDINHTFLSDLHVGLDKDGMAMTWMFQNIRTTDNLTCSGDDMLATLDDDASLSIYDEACVNVNTPAVEGTYAPQQSLANFNGMDADGTWNLFVEDDWDGDVGNVDQWCVHITFE